MKETESALEYKITTTSFIIGCAIGIYAGIRGSKEISSATGQPDITGTIAITTLYTTLISTLCGTATAITIESAKSLRNILTTDKKTKQDLYTRAQTTAR